MGFSESVVIRRPPAEVWAFLTDWSKAPAWMNGIDSMRQEGEGAPRSGTRLVFVARGSERASEIADWEPPKRLVLRSRQGGVTADYEYRLAETAEGTELTLSAECRFAGWWKLLSPLISRLMARADSAQPRQLQRAIEDGPRP